MSNSSLKRRASDRGVEVRREDEVAGIVDRASRNNTPVNKLTFREGDEPLGLIEDARSRLAELAGLPNFEKNFAELSVEQADVLRVLERLYSENVHGIERSMLWEDIQAKLALYPSKIDILGEMIKRGGTPEVFQVVNGTVSFLDSKDGTTKLTFKEAKALLAKNGTRSITEEEIQKAVKFGVSIFGCWVVGENRATESEWATVHTWREGICQVFTGEKKQNIVSRLLKGHVSSPLKMPFIEVVEVG